MINKKNYIQKAKAINFDKLPEKFKRGHELLMKMTSNGTDWKRYEESTTVKESMNDYLKKLNQQLKPAKIIPISDKAKNVQKKAKSGTKSKKSGTKKPKVITAQKAAAGKAPVQTSVKKSAELSDIEKFLRVEKRHNNLFQIEMLAKTIKKRLSTDVYKNHQSLLKEIQSKLSSIVEQHKEVKGQFNVTINLETRHKCQEVLINSRVVMRTDYLAGAKQKPRIAAHAKDLEWKESPDGYQFAQYKLGTIRRLDNSYMVMLGLNQVKVTKTLAAAIKKVDEYTKSKLNKTKPAASKN